jgi:hypothetical protein
VYSAAAAENAGACGKRTFNIWRLPPADLACHPVLSSLAQELAKFALTYLSGTLNLPPPRERGGLPSIEELNLILLNNLVERGGQHVRVWSTLELESELCAGVQRIRCNPFKAKKKDQAYGRNFSQYVAAIPPKKYTGISFKRFDVADVAHRQRLWFGRVELLFRTSFKSPGGRVFDLDLALFSFLYDFKCPAAMTIPSPGSYRPGVAVASVAGPLPAWRRCRRARTGTEGAPTGGGSIAGP